LSVPERERLARFRVQADQLRFLLGRGLLRTFVGAYQGVPAEQVEFQHGPFGKPAVVTPAGQPALQFNVSHSGQLVLLAFHPTQPVGVDVEALQPDFDWSEIARRMFPPDHYAKLACLQPRAGRAAFYQAWTRHEAVLKAVGRGFGEPAPSVTEPRPAVFDLQLPAGYRGAAALL
jgi:4'-phosphopantetheinyl transferase